MANVTIAQGVLKGAKSQTENGFEYYEFMGIPYAKPPVGNLRFKSPQPPEPWEGEWDATKIDPINLSCQHNLMLGGTVGSEDCLYLNVYTPKLKDPKELLPVMVCIHGGGFVGGSGIAKNASGPDYMIENNVVFVNFNYRLSLLGFLNLGIPEAAGNMGLKDQVKALKWVQRNIHAFGGDKNNVTVFGYSAGSAALEYLLLSRSAKGLFHKAILQSGSTLNHWAVNYDQKILVAKVLEQLEYKGPLDDSYAVLDFLSQIKDSELTQAASKAVMLLNLNRLCFGFVPTIEKDFKKGDEILTVNPYTLINDGKFIRVPTIRGFCECEGFVTLAMKASAVKELVKTKQFTAHWPYELNNEYNEKFSSAYSGPSKISDEPDQFAIDFFTDLDFAAGVWVAGLMMARTGVPIYSYIFTYDGQGNAIKTAFNLKHRKGAAHCDEAGYILKMETSKLMDDEDMLMKDKLTKMWTDFAKTGNPTPFNSKLPVQWPEFSEQSPVYLNIGKKFTLQENYEPEKMAVFEEIYAKYEK